MRAMKPSWQMLALMSRRDVGLQRMLEYEGRFESQMRAGSDVVRTEVCMAQQVAQ